MGDPVFLGQRGGKHAGIVGAKGDAQPGLVHGLDRGSPPWPPGAARGSEDAGEIHALVATAGHDGVVLEHEIAVVDALAAQHIEAGNHIPRGRRVLGSMRRAVQAAAPGEPVGIGEGFRRAR